MSTKYFCAHCDEEFIPEEAGDKPRCPHCMRRGGVEPVQEAATGVGVSRRWAIVLALLIVAAGIGYGLYVSTNVALEKTPPELSADIVDKGIVLVGGGSMLANLELPLPFAEVLVPRS